jgi:hypothetical protein
MNNVQELNFGYKVRHALNEQLDTLPASTTQRLASARQAAMARKKKDASAPLRIMIGQRSLVGYGGTMVSEPFSWLSRLGLILPLIVLVVGLIGIVSYEKQQRINETADLDAAMLTDDLPVVAYADHGFNAYLEKRAE